jgi:hypothetical protein
LTTEQSQNRGALPTHESEKRDIQTIVRFPPSFPPTRVTSTVEIN